MVASSIPLRILVPDLDPTQYKLHCAVWNGEVHPLDEFRRSWEQWVDWNRWRPARDDFNRRFIFSLMQVYNEQPHRWLFGAVFEVVGRGTTPRSHAYEIELREDVLPGCIGRLKLTYRPPGRAVRLRLESALDHIEVAEILPDRYAGEPFPGHGSINHSLRALEVIYAQKKPDWRGALEYMKGFT